MEPASLSPASFIDHTLLKADTTADRVRSLCEEAVEFGFASVCIPPGYVSLAAELLYGSPVAVGTVIGFPFGYVPSEVKIFETAEAVRRGAAEIDMVIQIGAALDGRLESVEEEIRGVVRAAGDATVKVILECCFLDDPLKTGLSERAVRAGAGFVKTSTGFGPSGATVEDVRLLKRAADGRIRVKASGGIRDWNFCKALLDAGADRIGTSAGSLIMKQWQEEQGLESR